MRILDTAYPLENSICLSMTRFVCSVREPFFFTEGVFLCNEVLVIVSFSGPLLLDSFAHLITEHRN